MTLNQESQNMMLRKGAVLRGTYRVDDYLASGGFGNTYVVTHVALNKQMALKEFFIKGVTHRENNQTTVGVSNTNNIGLFDEQKQKFRKEAQRLHELVSPNIVRVYDLFDENGTSYYVMDLVNGKSLEACMKLMQRPFPEGQVGSIVQQMLQALDIVHKADMLHMDIKPANILMDDQGHCTLIDFGSSKQTGPTSATSNTAMSYTPGYAPIEQINGTNKHWGPWTDFYALGATIYNLLTNEKPPFMDEILEKQADAFKFNENVSPKMRELILWMMQPSHVKRPQSSKDIYAFLNQPVPVEDVQVIENQPMEKPAVFNNSSQDDSEATHLSTEMKATAEQQPSFPTNNAETVIQQIATAKMEETGGQTASSTPQYPSGSVTPPKKKKTWLWVILGSVLALGLGVGAFFMLKKGGDTQKDSDTSSEPIVVAEPTTGVPAFEPLHNESKKAAVKEDRFVDELESMVDNVKSQIRYASDDDLAEIVKEFDRDLKAMAQRYGFENKDLEEFSERNQQRINNILSGIYEDLDGYTEEAAPAEEYYDYNY